MSDPETTSTTTESPPPAGGNGTTPPAEPTAASAATPARPAGTDDETLGEGGKKALDAERKARREAEARLKELEPLAEEARKKADAEKTELQKANEALGTERDARTKAETALLRFQVAATKGVPPKLADYLAGNTKEEIEASADVLLAEIGSGNGKGVPTKPTERIVSGQPSSTLDSEDPLALIRKARHQD